MNRQDVEAAAQTYDLEDELNAVKAKVSGGDTSEKTRAEYQAAKQALYDHRQVIRNSRDEMIDPGDGVATPKPVKAKTKGG